MKWVHLYDIYTWRPHDIAPFQNEAMLRKSRSYAEIPDELAERFQKAIDAVELIELEIEAYKEKK